MTSLALRLGEQDGCLQRTSYPGQEHRLCLMTVTKSIRKWVSEQRGKLSGSSAWVQIPSSLVQSHGDGSVGNALVLQTFGVEFRSPEPTSKLSSCISTL